MAAWVLVHVSCPDTRIVVFPNLLFLWRTDGVTDTFLPSLQAQREPGTRVDPGIFLLFLLPFLSSFLLLVNIFMKSPEQNE